MVASNSRKKLRKRQLDQVRRDERQKKTEDAVFGEYEDESIADFNNTDNDQAGQVASAAGGKATGEETSTGNDQKSAAAVVKSKKQDKKIKLDSVKKQGDRKPAAPESKKAPRFIVFVGNLPFTATNEMLKKHFAKIEPTSIRLGTDKASGKSRGFAFLEFDRSDRMNDCLGTYHHSMFDDGLGGEPRRINIELTAGGGGRKSNERKERIRVKNAKLADERIRRAKASKDKGNSRHHTGSNAQPGGSTMAEPDQSIHPSRLARITR